MKVCIDVKDRKEAAAIRHAMTLPEVRTFVVCIGVLDKLPSDRARARVLRYVADLSAEQHEAAEVRP